MEKPSRAISNEPLPWHKDKYSIKTTGEVAPISGDSLEELESGILHVQEGLDTGNMIVDLAITKIINESLYSDAGFKSPSDYAENSDGRLNMSRQVFWEHYQIGNTFLKYRRELEDIDFTPAGHRKKLYFLEKALKIHRKSDVFKKLQLMTFRDFRDYSVPRLPSAHTDSYDLNDSERKKLYTEIEKIAEGGNIPFVIGVYDTGEKRAITNFLKKFRSKK